MRVTRIEDRLDLTAAERRGVELIRYGAFPRNVVDQFKAREFRSAGFKPVNGLRPSEWDIVLAAVLENASMRQIAAWYRSGPGNVEDVVRKVLGAYAATEHAVGEAAE